MDPRTIKRILVPTNFSDPSHDALETAMAFAKAFGATLDLVNVAIEMAYPLPPPIDVATFPLDMTGVLSRSADGLAVEEKRVRDAGIACDSATLVGRPDTEIVARAKQTGADLIVMGTHGRSGLVHLLVGSNAERVVQHASCPVLIVPRREAR